MILKPNKCHHQHSSQSAENGLAPNYEWTQSSVVCKVARLWAGRSRFPNWAGVRNFILLQNIQSDSQTHPFAYSISTGVLSQE